MQDGNTVFDICKENDTQNHRELVKMFKKVRSHAQRRCRLHRQRLLQHRSEMGSGGCCTVQ